MDYKKYNDNELIYMVRENDEISTNILVNKYYPIILNISNEYYKKYNGYIYDFDDFYQEGLVSFYKALSTYNNTKDVLFYTYVVFCIRRSLSSFGKLVNKKKNKDENIDINELEYAIEDVKTNPINRDSYIELENIVRNVIFSLPLESGSILELKTNGFTYKEIGKLLDIPISSVEFKSRRARKMLRNRVMDYYCK